MTPKQKEILINNMIEATKDPAAWIGLGLIFLSLGWTVSSVTSCAATSEKARYESHSRTSESFWDASAERSKNANDD